MGLTRIRAQQITDIDYKQAVRVVTSSNVNLSSGAPNQVDGVTLSVGNRILVNGQTNKAQNGLYQVETVGAGSNGVWIRTSDGNNDGEIDPGMLVMVTEGNAYADTLWKLITNGTITIGVTELTFVLNTAFGFGNISANGTSVVATVQNDTLSLTAGENITIVGNAAGKTIEFSAVGGTPGGNTTEVQYNNAGSFAGSNNFTFDGSNVAVLGNVTANYFLGNGSQLSGIITSVANINNGTTNVSIDVINGPVTVDVGGIGNVAVVESNQLTFAANLIPSANITYNLGSSSRRWKDLWLANSTIYLGEAVLSANGNVLLVNEQSVITSASENSLTLLGNISGGNLISAGVVSGTTGAFTNVSGNGSALSSLPGANVTGTVANATYSINAGAATTAGTVTAAAQPNITSVGTLSSLSVSGNVTTGNVSGTIGLFTNVIGNGSGLSSITGANVTGTVANASYAVSAGSATSAITAGTVTTNAQPNITSVGTLSNLTVTGLATHTGNIDVTGNINVTGNLNYENVTDLVVGDPLIYIGANNTGNLFDLGIIVAWDDGLYQHGGWVRDASDGIWKLFGNVVPEPTTVVDFTNAIYEPMLAGSITSTGLISATGNITGGNLSGTNIVGTLTTAAQTNITSVGTLSSVTVTANVTGGNLLTGGLISATGNITGGNINTAGNVSAAFFKGDGSLLTGVAGGGGIEWTTSATAPVGPNPGDFWYDTDDDKKYQYINDGTGNAWVDQSAPTSFGNLTVGNILSGGANGTGNVGSSTGYFNTFFATNGTFTNITGNGRALTSLNASNIDTGTLPSGRLSGTYTITVSGAATTAGTVTTAAQPNITSVGTLTALTVTGDITGGNLLTTGSASVISIIKTGSNGVGNIGSSSNTFNTVFAKATSAQYADLAENYQADAGYEPGTVVVFGGSAEITISDISHDTRVAGVVSTNPSYLMNSGLTGSTVAAVALTGRVPCWVQGPVSKGDRIVNIRCGIGGRMKSAEYEPGCIVGKSLEDIVDNSVQLIEVVIGRF